MIHDALVHLPLYAALHPWLGTVVAFIDKEKLSGLEKGRIPLAGGLYALVDEYDTQDIQDTFLECHKKYIDIQVMLEGAEQIGLCHRNEARVIEAYDEEGDFEKLDGPLDLLTLRKGYFVLFHPQDGHAPGLKRDSRKERVKKIVFKIPC